MEELEFQSPVGLSGAAQAAFITPSWVYPAHTEQSQPLLHSARPCCAPGWDPEHIHGTRITALLLTQLSMCFGSQVQLLRIPGALRGVRGSAVAHLLQLCAHR